MLQETEHSAQSTRGLLWLIVFVAANIFFIYYVFEDQKLYRRLVVSALLYAEMHLFLTSILIYLMSL